MPKVVYNLDLALWQSCSNCHYCQKGAFKFSQFRRCNNPVHDARKKWYCDGYESPCVDYVDDPTSECCDHWLFY